MRSPVNPGLFSCSDNHESCTSLDEAGGSGNASVTFEGECFGIDRELFDRYNSCSRFFRTEVNHDRYQGR